MQNNELYKGCSPTTHITVFQNMKTWKKRWHWNCDASRTYRGKYIFHITFNEIANCNGMMLRQRIYRNQHNFFAFWSQLCILLFLETRGTPNFWRLAPYNRWHCRKWRCFLKKRQHQQKYWEEITSKRCGFIISF